MKYLFTIISLLFLSASTMILARGTRPQTGASMDLRAGSGPGMLCNGASFSMALDALPACHPLRQARDEEALVRALRQVPDRETMEFMTAFYRNWLDEKRTIPETFRKTQREMQDRFFNPYS